MAIYRLGAQGDEVREIQQRLQALGPYHGPLDGIYGDGTAAAVRVFQRRAGLEPDGAVGPVTWRALLGNDLQHLALRSRPLAYRCLALTGAFKTNAGFPECFAGLSGDFDGQGISFGVCQWNFGQDSLQPLLNDMLRRHSGIVQAIFEERYASFRNSTATLSYAYSGDTIGDMARISQSSGFYREITDRRYNALLLSGGGNDLFDALRLGHILRRPAGGENAATDPDAYVNWNAVNQLREYVATNYRQVLSWRGQSLSKNRVTPFILYTYDYPMPRPAKAQVMGIPAIGTWLYEPLVSVGAQQE